MPKYARSLNAEQVDELGEYLTIERVAELLGESRDAVYFHLRQYQIPCKMVGKTTLVRLEDYHRGVIRGKQQANEKRAAAWQERKAAG